MSDGDASGRTMDQGAAAAAKNIDGPDPLHETHNPIKGAAGDKTQGRDEHGNSGAPMFSSSGAIGSQFTKDGAIGGTAEKVGGPLSSSGSIGGAFTNQGSVGGTVEKMLGKGDTK